MRREVTLLRPMNNAKASLPAENCCFLEKDLIALERCEIVNVNGTGNIEKKGG